MGKDWLKIKMPELIDFRTIAVVSNLIFRIDEALGIFITCVTLILRLARSISSLMSLSLCMSIWSSMFVITRVRFALSSGGSTISKLASVNLSLMAGSIIFSRVSSLVIIM